MPPFLHVKFTSGRPPEFAGSFPFAHEVDPAKDALPESLKTDVQREGVLRYLRNNFKEGHFVHQVVQEREYDAMYALLTNNWRRSTGDGKLHLSLYIYQEDRHCATWHAYTDRSVSYSRSGDEHDPPPEGTDAYSTPEAMAAAASRPASPVAVSPTEDRPRFDRPAAAPDSDQEDGPSIPPPVPPLPISSSSTGRASRSSKKDRPAPAPKEDWDAPPPEDEQPPLDEWIKPPQGESDASDDNGVAPVKRSQPAEERSSRSSRGKKPARSESDEGEDLSKPAYPILKSKPIGRSRSRSPSPPPRSSRHSRNDRDASPEPPPRAPSHSTRRKDRSPSASPARITTAAIVPFALSSTSRAADAFVPLKALRAFCLGVSPAYEPLDEAPPGQPVPRLLGVSSSQPIPRSGDGRKGREASQGGDEEGGGARPFSVEVTVAVEVKVGVSSAQTALFPPAHLSPRDRHGGRGEDPPSSVRLALPLSPSLFPPFPIVPSAFGSPEHLYSGREAGPLIPTPSLPDDHPGRSPPRPSAPPASVPPLDRTPSWRSVSRNRHRRLDDSDDDTLVRGDLEDGALDIPAGGEVSLLDAKRRSASKDRSSRKPRPVAKDEGFDPSEVQKPPPPPPEKPTAKAVLGGWFKSVGALLKTDAELAVGAVEEKILEVEVHEEEARAKRKEERRKRREERAARRAEREREAEERALQTAAEEDEKAAKRADDLKRRADKLRREQEKAAQEKERALEELHHPKSSRSSRTPKPTEQEDQQRDTKRRSSRHRRPPSESDEATEAPPPPAPATARPASHSARRADPVKPPVEEDKARVRSSRHRHHGSSNVESPSELEEEPPARPPVRQRAMSISATVDAGLKNLRDSVAKIVSPGGGDTGETGPTREREGRRRKVASDSEEEQEREMLARSRQPSRSRAGRETDAEGGRSSRRKQPPPPSAPSESEFSDASPPPPTRQAAPPSRSARSDDEASDAPSRRSSRRAPRPPVDEDSDAPSRSSRRNDDKPKREQRHRRAPSTASESDLSDVPSRPSSRGTMRATSEEDTPAHKEAKRNAMLNSTTIPAETIRQLREEQFARGIRSVPASPATSRPPAFPSSSPSYNQYSAPSNSLLQEIEHAAEIGRHDRERENPSSKHNYRRHHDASESESSGDEQYSRHSQHRSQNAYPPLHAVAADLPPPLHAPVPPIPSPISPSDRNPYAYPLAGAPLRPQPVKPTSAGFAPAGPPQGGGRFVPAPSSAGSSDEGDPSRPPSSAYRERRGRGYRTADSESDAPLSSSFRQRDVPSSKASRSDPYRFSSSFDSDHEPELAPSRYSKSLRPGPRAFDRSPSPPPVPPHQQHASRRAPSFSTTQPAYPFSGDESELSPSESEGGSLPSSRFGPSSSAAASVGGGGRPRQRKPTTVYSDDSASDGGGGGIDVRGAGAMSSGSRTMVSSSNPSRQAGGSRTMVGQPAPAPAPYTSSGSRTMVSSSSSRSNNRPLSPASPSYPSFSSSPSFRSFPPAEDRFRNAGPSGFSGFDLRGSRGDNWHDERDHAPAVMSERALGKQSAARHKSGSRQMYGDAPVSRRMAKRLGM
ncbi:hypothetical protein JCM6882_006529 [Rhodosporidiobolus microsporus]